MILILVRCISLSSFPRRVLLLTHEPQWKLADVDRSVGARAHVLLVDDVVNLLLFLGVILDRSESAAGSSLWWHRNLLLPDFDFV